MRHIVLRHYTEDSENRLFYLKFSNIKEFLSLYIRNLNIGLQIFVIRCNVDDVCIRVVIEKVNEKGIHDSLLDLERLIRKGARLSTIIYLVCDLWASLGS